MRKSCDKLFVDNSDSLGTVGRRVGVLVVPIQELLADSRSTEGVG
jgi:hypothetical protein